MFTNLRIKREIGNCKMVTSTGVMVGGGIGVASLGHGNGSQSASYLLHNHIPRSRTLHLGMCSMQ